MSAREAALLALFDLVKQAAGIEPQRATDIPILDAGQQRAPDNIWLGPGEAAVEAMLSPRLYSVQRTADLRLLVVRRDEAARDAAMDALLSRVGQALLNDPTLNGVVEFAEAQPPILEVGEANGAGLAALLPVVLTYTTSDPAGA